MALGKGLEQKMRMCDMGGGRREVVVGGEVKEYHFASDALFEWPPMSKQKLLKTKFTIWYYLLKLMNKIVKKLRNDNFRIENDKQTGKPLIFLYIPEIY